MLRPPPPRAGLGDPGGAEKVGRGPGRAQGGFEVSLGRGGKAAGPWQRGWQGAGGHRGGVWRAPGQSGRRSEGAGPRTAGGGGCARTNLPLLQKTRHVRIVVVANILLLLPRRRAGLAGRPGRALGGAGPRRQRRQQQLRGAEKDQGGAHPAGGSHLRRAAAGTTLARAAGPRPQARLPTPPPALAGLSRPASCPPPGRRPPH